MLDDSVQRLLYEIDRRASPLGLTDRALSLKAGLGADFVRNIRRGKTRDPGSANLKRIADLLGCTVDQLLGTKPGDQAAPPPPAASDVGLSPGELSSVAVARGIALPPLALMPRDLPVYGTAAGADDGVFELNTGEAIDWLRRPPGLQGLKDIFGIYVVDESMAPRFEPGEAVIVHPGKPPVPGCDVIVELKDADEAPRKAILKRLVRRTSTKLVLEQFNPKKTVEIPLSKIAAVHRVLRWHEVLGV